VAIQKKYKNLLGSPNSHAEFISASL